MTEQTYEQKQQIQKDLFDELFNHLIPLVDVDLKDPFIQVALDSMWFDFDPETHDDELSIDDEIETLQGWVDDFDMSDFGAKLTQAGAQAKSDHDTKGYDLDYLAEISEDYRDILYA